MSLRRELFKRFPVFSNGFGDQGIRGKPSVAHALFDESAVTINAVTELKDILKSFLAHCCCLHTAELFRVAVSCYFTRLRCIDTSGVYVAIIASD